MLRIIAGKYRSLQIDQPDLEITRPTTDRVRESIFNIIQSSVNSSIVLDAFSGSGAMAIEAVSRGAIKAICVEENKKAFDVIASNVFKLQINNIDLYNEDVFDFIEKKENIQFDLIFLDPPYTINPDKVTQLLEKIVEKNFLKKYGMIIYETNINSALVLPKKLLISKEREYGNTKIFILKNIV